VAEYRYNYHGWRLSSIVFDSEGFRKGRRNMKNAWGVGFVVLLASGLAETAPVSAQGVMDRLESGIRTSNRQPEMAVAPAQRVYLGAVADDDAGRGVRVLSIRSGGPADRAGLQPQDLVVGAAGSKIRLLSELAAILNSRNPGDRVALEVMRGIRPVHMEVVLGLPPGATPLAQPNTPPETGLGAGRTESIPPPPGDVSPPPTSEGPSLVVPGAAAQPFPPKSTQTQIEQLQRRLDQMERRVEELERTLGELRRNK
jgi:hypothetical protein